MTASANVLGANDWTAASKLLSMDRAERRSDLGHSTEAECVDHSGEEDSER